jgi:hypothetical protein
MSDVSTGTPIRILRIRMGTHHEPLSEHPSISLNLSINKPQFAAATPTRAYDECSVVDQHDFHRASAVPESVAWHQTLRVTPAMEGGLSDHVWMIEELCRLLPQPISSTREMKKNLVLKALGE